MVCSVHNSLIMRTVKQRHVNRECHRRAKRFSSVQFLDRLGLRWDVRDNSAEILFQSFLAGGPCGEFWHGQGCPLFDVVHPGSTLLTTASLALQVVLEPERLL